MEEAQRRLDDLREYVRGRGMTSALPILLMSEAKVASIGGDHEAAMGFLDECLEELADKGFTRDELDVHAARVLASNALGDADRVRSARAGFEAVAREILSRIGEEDLRAAFGQSVLDMVDEV
jgi:hypothetical protein